MKPKMPEIEKCALCGNKDFAVICQSCCSGVKSLMKIREELGKPISLHHALILLKRMAKK